MRVLVRGPHAFLASYMDLSTEGALCTQHLLEAVAVAGPWGCGRPFSAPACVVAQDVTGGLVLGEGEHTRLNDVLLDHARDWQVRQEGTGECLEHGPLESVYGGNPEVELGVGGDIETPLGVPGDGTFHSGKHMFLTLGCVGMDGLVQGKKIMQGVTRA